jgi:ABC-type nitrate/sulfonate/bicarbonate transport system substrate-binding protein
MLDTIWYTRCPVPSATGIAIQRGWLEEEFAADGIAVRSLRHSPDRNVRETHFTHRLENMFRQGGNAPPLYAKSQGEDIALLGLYWVPQYQGILTLPQSGIRTLADLRGRRLALPTRPKEKIDFFRSMALQSFVHALQIAGLAEDDVTFENVAADVGYVDEAPANADGISVMVPRLVRQQTPEVTALVRGEVDAIFGHSVWGVELREMLGLRELINLARQPDRQLQINNGQPKVLTVSGGLLREHPDLVARYVAQLERAAAWAREHPDEARRAVAIETGSAEYWLDEGTGAQTFAHLDMSFDPDLLQALDVRKNFLLERGFIKHDFDVFAWAGA